MSLPASIVVPASTSNLGAGFDTLGLAVNRFLTVRIVATTQGPGLRSRFLGAVPPGDNYVEVGYRVGLGGAASSTGLDIEIETNIPPRAGLGSSAAAYVAGLRLAALVAPRTPQELLAAATRLEGHPDNASASLLGGFTVSAVDDWGRVTSRAFRWPAQFKLVLGVPRLELATSEARAVLPTHVSVPDAVFNIQRAASLVAGVLAADPDLIRVGLDDRLHQPARAALVPGLSAMLALRHPRLLGAFLSGAGPSVIAVCLDDASEVHAMVTDVYQRLSIPALVDTVEAVAPLGS
jgi:homoserine kinase